MTVTIKQIAEKSGLSWPTVSRILNDKGGPFRPETRRRVLETADRLGYRPNSAARAMRNRRSMQIGVLLCNAPDRPFHYLNSFEMVLGVNAQLEPAGYVLSLIRFDEVNRDVAEMSRVFREHVLDGMIVLGWYPDHMHRRIAELCPKCVWLETNVWRDKHCIRRDDRHAGSLVAEQLAALGYRRAAWLGPPRANDDSPHFSVRQRREGVEAVCRRSGVTLCEIEVNRRADRKLIMPELGDVLRPDTAVIAYNTQLAMALTQHAAAMGRCAGIDYGLACCDETQEVAEAWPGLSRVSNDRFDLGRRAARMMLDALEERGEACSSQLAMGQWVIGDTVMGPGSGRAPNSQHSG